MFHNSSGSLRAWFRNNPAIHGRCQPLSKAHLHGPSKPAFSLFDVFHKASHAPAQPVEVPERPPFEPAPHERSPAKPAAPPNNPTESPPVKFSRVQSNVQARRRSAQTETSKARVATYLSHQIFGAKDRTISKRLAALKVPGPQAVSVLLPAALGSSYSTKWGYPPHYKSVFSDADISPALNDAGAFRNEWRPQYLELYFQSRDGNFAKAQEKLDVYRQVAESFVGNRSVDKLRKVWANMRPAKRLRSLAPILLGCLADGPRKTLLVLSLFTKLPSRDWRTRCECLCQLDLMHADEIAADPYLQASFAQQIEKVSRVWEWPPYAMQWSFLVLLLRHNQPDQCENIMDTILQDYDPVPPRLLLIMVDHLTGLGDADRAVELLSRIPPEQRDEHKGSHQTY